MTLAAHADPLATREPERRGALLVAVVAAVGAHALFVGGFAVQASLRPSAAAEAALVWIDVPPAETPPPTAPEPEAPQEPEPPAEEPELEVAALEPPVEAPQTPEPPPRPRPEAATPPPQPPPRQTVRPIEIGLEGNSFSNGSGPMFAAGDTARGGRPNRVSVDPNDTRTPVANAPATPPPVEPSASPAAAPGDASARGRRPPRDRDPRLRPGVRREPPYPETARSRRVETDCRVLLTIDESGNVADIGAVQCSESGYGFEAAVQAHVAEQLRFEPAIQDGVPVSRRISWTFEFRLE